jgi:hypothetical protein
MKDRLRSHSRGHADSVIRQSQLISTQLDALDAILYREGIDCLYEGGPGTVKVKDEKPTP